MTPSDGQVCSAVGGAPHQLRTRICLVSMLSPLDGSLGGAERQCWLLARGLAVRGHIVVLAATRSSAPSASIGSLDGVQVLSLPGTASLRARREALEAALILDPVDVCYVRDVRWFAPAVDMCQRLGIPCVVNYYSATQAGGWGFRILWLALMRLSPRAVAQALTEPALNRKANAAAAKADLRIVQTGEIRASLAAHYGLDAVVLPNMQPVLAGREAGPPDDRPRSVLWVGKDTKRPEMFLDAAETLSRSFPDTEFVLVCRLSPDSRRGARLLRRIAGMRSLRHVNGASQDVVEEMYRSACVYVHTSAAEGFPNTFLEAFAAGVPVVSLRVDPDGLLGNEGVGVACGGDSRKMVAAIAELLADGDLRRRMGSAGRSYVARVHDAELLVPRYETTFAGLISLKAAAG